jgi:hypothetical protein
LRDRAQAHVTHCPPGMKTLRFGIEIETVGLGKEGAARAIAAVVGGSARPGLNGAWEAVATDGRVWRFPMGA